MGGSEIPSTLLELLRQIEPGAEFTGSLPKVRSSAGRSYFVKIGSVNEKEQYIGESESLKAINAGAPGLAPRVFAIGETDGGFPYLISEYKDLSGLTEKAGETLGRRLAVELHKYESLKGFGFGVPTYCGATRLTNGWFDTWESCFSAMIEDLLKQLKVKAAYTKLVEKGDRVRKSVIPKLLGSLVIHPVLLHGDLWSGNTGVDGSLEKPVIFDPSSYYGHNEADLAIARIFGGIPRSFFTTYHALYPKSEPADQYTLRGDLYELFHYLNHTLLFGGYYAEKADVKMDTLLKAVELMGG